MFRKKRGAEYLSAVDKRAQVRFECSNHKIEITQTLPFNDECLADTHLCRLITFTQNDNDAFYSTVELYIF